MNGRKIKSEGTEFIATSYTDFLECLLKNKVVGAVMARVMGQQEKGLNKYGELVNSDNLDLLDWIEHKQQETTDELIYLECIKQKLLDERKRGKV